MEQRAYLWNGRRAVRKVIFLVDMNAFFISCEMTRNPHLSGKPAAVAGDPKRRTGIILAANYEARARGVRTAMVLHEALRLCPDMLLVPPDHDFYEEKSEEVMRLLANYTPVLEQNSIDEAWLDMTGTEGLFGTPREAAGVIMKNIGENLGLPCSIGIAQNKFLAKMASEMKKPLGITELWGKDIPAKLWSLPVKSMYGVGGKTAQRLLNLGITSIGELARFDKTQLLKIFGKSGLELHLHANGLDSSPLIPRSMDDMKSIGRSTTLSENITDLEKARVILLDLAEDVGMTVRRHGKKGRTVQITIKYSDFKVVTRQATVSPTCVTQEIFQAGFRLLQENWNPDRPVRLLGISVTGFEQDGGDKQLSIFDLAIADGATKILKAKMYTLGQGEDLIINHEDSTRDAIPETEGGSSDGTFDSGFFSGFVSSSDDSIIHDCSKIQKTGGDGQAPLLPLEKQERIDRTMDAIRSKYGRDRIVRGRSIKPGPKGKPHGEKKGEP